MAYSLSGMALGGKIDAIGLPAKPGCRLRVLVVSDPDYGSEAYDGEAAGSLTSADIEFWQRVLDEQRQILNSV